MCVPIALALLLNDGPYRQAGLLLSAVFALWTARSLRPALWSAEKDIKSTAGGLLAGFVFVDLLAVANAPREISFIFLLLFGLALVFQRPIGQKVP